MRTISKSGPEHTKLSHRVAADLARKMRADGWPVTKPMLYGSTPSRIAHKLAAKNDPDAPARLTVRICRLAGLTPPGDGTTAGL